MTVVADEVGVKSRKDNVREWIGQSFSSLLCIADDRSRRATIAAKASVGVPPNDTWASLVLVSMLPGYSALCGNRH